MSGLEYFSLSLTGLSIFLCLFPSLKVLEYLQKKFAELGSPNKMKVSMGHGAKAWVSDFNHPHYIAGRKAMKTGTGTVALHSIKTDPERLSQHFHELMYYFVHHSISLSLLCSAVFGVEPDLTREGGSIPVTLTFQEATGRNVMLLPMGSSDDGAHSQNEKINRYVSLVCKGSGLGRTKGPLCASSRGRYQDTIRTPLRYS